MGLVAGREGDIDGYEPVQLKPDPATKPQPQLMSAASLFRRRSAQPSRRGVLHLQTARDTAVPPDLASWYTERGFHFYVAELRWPGGPRGRGKVLAATFDELDAKCDQLRGSEGIDNIIVTAHGEGAQAAAEWCAADRPGRRTDALILYAPSFSRKARKGLEVSCPVLVIGGAAEPSARRGKPAGAVHLGRHVTWLRPTDGEARPDAQDAADRSRFFDEMGRWLGAYMYGQVRDQLL
jgi:alpha-beta hydrolase superfamily lysophospholipase